MGWWQQHFFHRVWGKIKWKTREALKKRCASAAAKSLQSCPTLCDPIDSSPPGSPIPGILQARTPEWVAISLSNAWKWKVKGKSLSRVWFFATPWTAAHQAPPPMGFSRQEYWSGVPLPWPLQKSYCHHTVIHTEVFGFSVHIKVRLTLHSSLPSVQ